MSIAAPELLRLQYSFFPLHNALFITRFRLPSFTLLPSAFLFFFRALLSYILLRREQLHPKCSRTVHSGQHASQSRQLSVPEIHLCGDHLFHALVA
jgi:hypothetical protein